MLAKKFEEQVARTPDKIAVNTLTQTLTYRGLNRYAEGIARQLIDSNAGETVGLLFEHGLHMIAAILGVLKAGKVYVPLSVDYPENRIAYMLSNSQSSLLLTQPSYASFAQRLAEPINVRVLVMDGIDGNWEGLDDTHNEIVSAFVTSEREPRMDQIAYILYTSGSTGQPKGVVQIHKNVDYYTRNWVRIFSITEEDRMTLFSSFCHDGSVQDMFSALHKGATLYPLNMKNRQNVFEVSEFLVREKITIWHSVPSLYSYFANTLTRKEEFKDLRFILLGGEPVRQHEIELFKRFFPHSILANVYGQTESSVNSICLYKRDHKYKNSQIGMPLDETKILIIDEKGRPASTLEPGEILVVCNAISPGYWKNPEATAKAFGENKDMGRFYWTGDLGRRMVDGSIEFLGRRDLQVKIRGFRVEPGEIETQLLKHGKINEAVVIVREDKSGDKFLVAYMVTPYQGDEELKPVRLREFLGSQLPDYMIPTYFVFLEKMPLTPGGKIDRKSLPDPGMVQMEEELTVPSDEWERKLVEIWAEVLSIGKDKIGIDTDFFQAGGHSLKATIMTSMIHKEFDVPVPLAVIFKYPTIRKLSEYLKKETGDRVKGYDAIHPVEKREYYPQSSAQKRLFFLNGFEETGTHYNITMGMRVRGSLNMEKFNKTLNELIERHEPLRTSFHMVAQRPVQKVHDVVDFKVEEYFLNDERGGDKENGKRELRDLFKGFIRPFDLSRAPLFRAGVFKVGKEELYLLFDMHHIIGDGTSIGILTDDFIGLYNGVKLKELEIQYKDYSVWQEDAFSKGLARSEEEYWLSIYPSSSQIPRLELLTDFPRPLQFSFKGARYGLGLDEKITAGIRKIGMSTHSTVYMVLLAALNVLFHKYTGQDDIILGCQVMGRPHADLQKIMGMFVNSLAMRNYPADEKTCLSFIEEVRYSSIRAFENENLPFEELVEKLNPPRDPSRNPLFDITFVLQNFERANEEMKALDITPITLESGISKFDITFFGYEVGEEIHFIIEYCTSLFKEETIKRMGRHLTAVLELICKNPEGCISEIDPVSEEEKQELLLDFNNTATDYPWDKYIHELFMEQAQVVGDRVAVRGENEVTYGELNRWSDWFAYVLKGHGVVGGDIVGIELERSVELLVVILGILKVGGVYLPLDRSFPRERIDYMLKDSGAKILVDGNFFEKEKKRRGEEGAPLTETNTHGAYVMYTSGTTGKPKGVLVGHGSVIRLVKNTNFIEFKETDCVLPTGAISFDASTFEIWGPLLNGAGVCLVPTDTLLNTESLGRLIKNEGITVMWMTSGWFNQVCSINPMVFGPLRVLLVGGDVLLSLYIGKIRSLFSNLEIINGYGPTENTTFSTTYSIKEIGNENIPIGKPIANSTAYIVDKYFRPVPVGIGGELLVGGEGLAMGYLNNPELTVEKFVCFDLQGLFLKKPPLHLAKTFDNSNFIKNSCGGAGGDSYKKSPLPARGNNKIIYRTGDYARFLPDGNIEFLGRLDSQVKVRGYRIELGEVESGILKCEGVKEVVVSCITKEANEKALCAYIVFREGNEMEIGEMRVVLSRFLPDYMVPSYFIKMERLPLTPAGKVERSALPLPEGKVVKEYEGPRNRIERELIGIWSGLLGVGESEIGIDDNFFEIGGHSLKAAVLVAKIQEVFNVFMGLKDIFIYSTVREMGRLIGKAERVMHVPVVPVEEKEYYPLSSAQERLYLLQTMSPEGTHYNMPFIMPVGIGVQREKLESIFKQLIVRHSILRTSFHMIGEQPVQRIHENIEFSIDEVEPAIIEGYREGNKYERVKTIFRKRFDLSFAPLLRVKFIKDETNPFLMIDMHHILSDAVSQGILKRDFIALAEGRSLSPLKLDYKDYTGWLNSSERNEAMKKQEIFWLGEYRDIPAVLELPYDFNRPVVQSFEGNVLQFILSDEQTRLLKEVAFAYDATLYMVILGVFTILLSRLGQQEDIVIGTPVAARRHVDLQDIAGMMINTLAIRNYPVGSLRVDEYLREVKTRTLDAFENQEYPFEELVKSLSIQRDTGRNPLFDIMLSLINHDELVLEPSGGVNVNTSKEDENRGYQHKNGTSRFDMTMVCMDGGDYVGISVEYGTALFKGETVERFMDYFKRIIDNALSNRLQKIEEIDILSEEERETILYEFNNTSAEYLGDKPIHCLFEEQVEKTPDRVVLHGFSSFHLGEHFSYRELNKFSNGFSVYLKEKGVIKGDLVMILMESSIEMIVGILGILKNGCGYVTNNPKNPEARTAYVMKDTASKILVTKKIIWDAMAQMKEGEEFVSVPVSSSDPAYVIYTSGSTGKPKGVVVQHGSLANLCFWHNRDFGVTWNDRATLYANPAFDASVWETFPYLISGAGLYIINDEIKLDVEKINGFFDRYGVTVAFLPTPVCEQFMLSGLNPRSLRLMLTGGDRLSRLEKTSYDLVNNYGPTECTVVATSFRVTDKTSSQVIPIGKPIQNTEIYIMTAGLQLQPVGVLGELFIGGLGLSMGYLNNPELTQGLFLKKPPLDPTKTSDNNILIKNSCGGAGGDSYKKSPLPARGINKIIYRTGDYARFLPDGNIEFLGRMDEQVKIRGNRIEPGEIASLLCRIEGIKEAVVVAIGENENKALCAYVVPGGSGGTEQVNPDDIKRYMGMELPSYMVPRWIITLERIPLTANGKVDRKGLPLPKMEDVEELKESRPRNVIEKKLAKIWAGILNIKEENIGVERSFFEIGGHSLKAAVLVSRIKEEFLVHIPIVQVFKTPCIRDMGLYIAQANKEAFERIEPVEERLYYPLSPGQRRLFILQQVIENNTGYNMPMMFPLDREWDIEALHSIFEELIRRHESLRTSFEIVDGQPVQRIHTQVEFFIRKDEEPKVYPFDLTRAPLFRVIYISSRKLGGNPALFMDMHHIITDGVSQEILKREFLAIAGGETLPLPLVRYRDYSVWFNKVMESDWMNEQERYWLDVLSGTLPVSNLPYDFQRPGIQSFEGKRVDFQWEGYLKDSVDELIKGKGLTLYMIILGVFTILLSKLEGGEDIIIGTPIAARKEAGLQDVIGMMVNTLAVRQYPYNDMALVDFFMELKTRTLDAFENGDYPFEVLVDKLQLARDVGRNPVFDVMFNLLNQVEFSDEMPVKTGSGKIEKVPSAHKESTAKFDLMLTAVELVDSIHFSMNYSTGLFKEKTIDGFVRYFEIILKQVLESYNDSGFMLGEIEIITDEEKSRILNEFNDTQKSYTVDKTIYDVFADQVKRAGDGIAIEGPSLFSIGDERKGNEGNDIRLTYEELNREACGFALFLNQKGVMGGDIVAIRMERSIEMMTGIFGILRRGGIYLPISMDYPQERIDFILKDSGAKILVDIRFFEEFKAGKILQVKKGDRQEIEIIEMDEKGDRQKNEKWGAKRNRDIAYVIYTSGTTGKPKGALIEHHSVINRLNWMQRAFPIGENDKILQKTPIVFDVSVWELFWWSFTGASLYLLKQGEEKNPESICNAIITKSITTLHFVPSMLSAFLDYVQAEVDPTSMVTMRQVFASGEALGTHQVKTFNGLFYKTNSTALVNLYGPTEATVDVSYFDCRMEEDRIPANIPIGKPIDNIMLFVLDKCMNLLPGGITGELCIAGAGLAGGYLNRPDLTAEKFVYFDLQGLFLKKPPLHPIKTSDNSVDSISLIDPKILNVNNIIENSCGDAGGDSYKKNPLPSRCINNIIYKTGDLARWLDDGNIEYLGRMDQQLKIRGYRIEPGEIETMLLTYSGIKEAVVLAVGENENRALCAYVVPSSSHGIETLNIEEIKQSVSAALPSYMVPSWIIPIERIPLTSNGKIDRRELPLPGAEQNGEVQKPQDMIEGKLAEIWAEILGISIDSISTDRSFFEVGGHSLKATSMILHIRKEFMVKITLADVFRLPRIKDLAGLIRSKTREELFTIEPAEVLPCYPLSPSQKRWYITHYMNPEEAGCNMPHAVILEGIADFERLENAFKQIILRHEALRTGFMMKGDQPVQVIYEDVGLEIEHYKLQEGSTDSGSSYPMEVLRKFSRVFDLETPPLLRVGLLRFEEKKHLLMVDMHHIVSDGVTLGIIIRDFVAFYAGSTLPPLRLQYKDYSQWLNRFLSGSELRKQKEYWLGVFENGVPELDLPVDFPRPAIYNPAGDTVSFKLDNVLADKMKQRNFETNTTPYMFILTALKILLHRYTGHDEIVVGSVIAGRNHPDLQNIVGVFLNMLPMKNRVMEKMTCGELLEQVKTGALGAYDNQDFQFDELVNLLGIPVRYGKTPIFDVHFTFQDAMDYSDRKEDLELPGLQVSVFTHREIAQTWELGVTAIESGSTIVFTLDYLTALFKKSTIEAMGRNLVEILEQSLENPGLLIGDLVLSERQVSVKSAITDTDVSNFSF